MTLSIKTSLALVISTLLWQSPVLADDTVVTVNGTAITQTEYDEYLTAREKRDSSHSLPSDKETIITELVRRTVVLQDAQQLKLDKTPAFIQKMEKARQNLLMEFAVKHDLEQNPISEEKVKSEYDLRVKKIKLPLQYKAKHILVTSESLAKELIAKLNKGEDFATLAKKHSSDKGSGAKGGDLGWFDTQQMVPEFSNAVKDMEKGTISKTPVKTQFGWHIIQMEDSRTAPPPAYDSVKDKLKENLEGMQMMAYMEALVKKAKIEKKK